MVAVTTIETRLRIELERDLLARAGPLPAAVLEDIEDTPSLHCLHRWNVVRAADLVTLLQPWTERPASDMAVITKVAGARYTLLIGMVDEPWVQVLVDEGDGRLTPWRGRRAEKPIQTIIGTPDDLDRLALPRRAAEIEALLRRGTALKKTVDWMLVAVFGVDIYDLATWLTALATTNEPAFIALMRRDVVRGTALLGDEGSRINTVTGRQVRSLRNLYEIARLVELMRSMAGPGRTTAEDLIVSVSSVGLTASRMDRADPGARSIADGWMNMQTLHAFRHHRGAPLSPSFPLVGYGLPRRQRLIGIEAAIRDPATFTFYADALRSEKIVAGTTRTLVRVQGEQPVDFFCGIELMRLAVVALRAIARKAGHPSALNQANRGVIGRLALYLLREVDPVAYDAYADQWSSTRAVRAAGLSRRNLDDGLTDPELAADIASALVIKTEKVRRFVAVTPESVFDPFLWNRRPSQAPWTAYHRVACSQIAGRKHDGVFRRQVLASVAQHGIDMAEMFDNDPDVVAAAVTICAEVGGHGTPFARDPKLFSFALQQAAAAMPHSSTPASQMARLRIVPRASRKVASLARRDRNAPS